jgi:hypothetical protein
MDSSIPVTIDRDCPGSISLWPALRRQTKHQIPALVYALILLVCAIVAFPLGLFFGIDLACTSDSKSNLCG